LRDLSAYSTSLYYEEGLNRYPISTTEYAAIINLDTIVEF
jgi:hypothetical protein